VEHLKFRVSLAHFLGEALPVDRQPLVLLRGGPPLGTVGARLDAERVFVIRTFDQSQVATLEQRPCTFDRDFDRDAFGRGGLLGGGESMPLQFRRFRIPFGRSP
jgi:hypothetical protein